MAYLVETNINEIFDALACATANRIKHDHPEIVWEEPYKIAKELLVKWRATLLEKTLLSSKGLQVYEELLDSLEWKTNEHLSK